MPVKSFVVFCFDVEIGGQMNAATSFNDKDDIQVSRDIVYDYVTT